jgi:hypothetical protein
MGGGEGGPNMAQPQVSGADELTSGHPEKRVRTGPAFVERAFGISDRTGLLTIAVMCSGLAVASFVASLVFDWAHTDVHVPGGSIASGGDGTSIGGSVEGSYGPNSGGLAAFGTSYLLGLPLLLGVAGLAVGWPHQANRLRVAATAFGAGLAAILIAFTLDIPDQAAVESSLSFQTNAGPVTTDYTKGLYFAYGAVVLSLLAVWLAAPTPWRRLPPSTMDIEPYRWAPAPSTWDGRVPVPVAAPPPEPILPPLPPPPPPNGAVPPGSVTGLSVSGGEPIEWRNPLGESWR